MSSAPPAAPAPVPPHEPSMLAAFLSFLVPGLGQIYQKRYAKGILFMVSLLGMFYLGQAMGNWQNVYLPRGGHANSLGGSLMQRWHFIGQFWIGVSSWPAVWQFFGGSMPSEEKSRFLHNYQKAPSEREVNDFLVNSDKTPDLGWVYTVIAGMLNLLVIYDAYAGPMFPAGVKRPEGDQAGPKPQPAAGGAS